VIIDSGNFPWDKHAKRFPQFHDPSEGYHGLRFWPTFGRMSYIVRARVEIQRDLGAALNPFAAQQLLLGIETLSLRCERHASNALTLAKWLEANDNVAWVSYPGLPSHGSHALAKKYAPRGAGGMLSFGVKGGEEAGKGVVNGFKLISHVANVGDSKTLAIHPWTTTHEQLNDEEKLASGVTAVSVPLSSSSPLLSSPPLPLSCSPQARQLTNSSQDLIRISVGTEHIDDIIADFTQSFAQAATKPETEGEPANKDVTGDGEPAASLSGAT
jgi:O-acetylhomoserine/O-acetylserine sulfhydrylase